MLQDCSIQNNLDEQGNPAGGIVKSIGLSIEWQNGPLGQGADRKEPTGCFVETVINAVIARIEFYQSTKFKCLENEQTLKHLRKALGWQKDRTSSRELKGIEGTLIVNK